MENITNYLKKNFFTSIGKIALISLTTLLLLPLIIKRIGLELYGVVSLTLLFSGVSSLVDLGLSKAVVLLSGEKKLTENEVVCSALIINLSIISLLFVVFIMLQLLSIDLLGTNLNVDKTTKFLILNIGFLLLTFMLLNNLCRAILEANYLMHIVNLSLAIYTPVLYLSIFILSFFTTHVIYYVLTPLLLTLLLFVFNVIYIKSKTQIKRCKVDWVKIKYVFKNSIGFLNLGLINSMVIPVMQYLFVLIVADVSLYALFDLSFKIAILANSVIVSLSMPMFAVFSKESKTRRMVNIALKVFYLSGGMYIIMLIGYYFIGNFALSFLDLAKDNLDVLYSITFLLIASIGSAGVVEVFYRYFMGIKKLTKAFLMKLIIPVFALAFFFALNQFSHINRFIYAYSIGVFVSSIIVIVFFLKEEKKIIKQ